MLKPLRFDKIVIKVWQPVSRMQVFLGHTVGWVRHYRICCLVQL